MSTIPQISIVTPSFNQARYIEETLQSVKNQECPSLENIVVDGASTDGTVDILKRYSAMPGWQHLRWISEPDNCQCDALNKGFQMAKGSIIGWLNSDDLYEPGCVSKALEALETNHDVDFVYGDYRIIDEAGKELILKREIAFDWDIMLCGLNYIAQPNVFFRKRVFDTLGYLNNSLHYVMDYDFWLRAASNGFRFQHIPIPFAACRWHLDAKTVSRNPQIYEELRSVRDNHWNKRQFRNRSLQTAYQQYCNLHARVTRQWRKFHTRHAFDFIPASWYLEMWKTLHKPQTHVE